MPRCAQVATSYSSRRPERRAWEEWIDPPPLTVDVPGIGPVERILELTEVSLPLVSFRFTFRFLANSTTLSSDSTIRFRDRDDLVASLRAGGFRVRDVRYAPDRPGQEFVLLNHRD